MQANALLMGESIRDAAENKLTTDLLSIVIVRVKCKMNQQARDTSHQSFGPIGGIVLELFSTALYTRWGWSSFSSTPRSTYSSDQGLTAWLDPSGAPEPFESDSSIA